MVDLLSVLTNTDGVPYPNTLTVNATGAGTGDGTELVKILMDQFVGSLYAIMDEAGLTPDSITEAPGTSQMLEAIRRVSGSPGEGVIWWKSADPATTGDRVLLLTGQVIAIANYPLLVAATYTGDGTNGTASAFYKTSDAGGTTRDTAGGFFVLLDTRGYFLRGLDVAASIDPDGASRDMGSAQLDAGQGHEHNLQSNIGTDSLFVEAQGTGATANGRDVNGTAATNNPRMETTGPITNGIDGTPRTSSETRPVNIATKFGIRY